MPRPLPWVWLALLVLPFHPAWIDFEQVRRGMLLVLAGAVLVVLPRLPRVRGERWLLAFVLFLAASAALRWSGELLQAGPDHVPTFQPWEAAYRLKQAAPYWPEGTVFVSVVDPGVGSERKAIVLQTKSGHYFVGPDNGTFSLIAEDLGIAAVRAIDEKKHRRRGSDRSHTFHGRDVFAFVALVAVLIFRPTGLFGEKTA